MVNGVPKTIRHSYSGMYADDKIIWDQNQNLPIPPKEIGVNASRVLEVVCKVGFEIIAQQNHINCLLPKKSVGKDDGDNWRGRSDRSNRRKNPWSKF
jgi:hypothetical protein